MTRVKVPAKPAKKTATRKRATTPKPVKAATSRKKTDAVSEPQAHRRAIFIDVENTSSEAALVTALDQLGIDRQAQDTELVAVGNWRVIGQHVARMLAQRGARLVHTAPATGVKDWSDLSIAVAAGIWLGRAQAGDSIAIVSADRAFDAVADAAANLGVAFHRLVYGGAPSAAERVAPVEGASRRRRSHRGGRRRRGSERAFVPTPPWQPTAVEPTTAHAETPTAPALPSGSEELSETVEGQKDIHAASPDQIVSTIARLTARAPQRGVNLDLLINALKDEGFGRPPGSPRLVTRLRKMRDIEVSPTGMVRLVGATALAPHPAPASEESPSPRHPRRRGGRRRRTPSAAAASDAASPTV